jgi:predicted DCC family thiol-disulfide oxidoreductase YuxK
MDLTRTLRQISKVSPGQFALFRIILGAYLLQHFLWMLPWAGELYGTSGMLPDPNLNPTYRLFPSPFMLWGGPAAATLVVAALALLSASFMFGWHRRIASALLWYGWACLFNRNNLTSNPSIPYVGLILLFCALVPMGEPFSLTSDRNRQPNEWFFPAWIFRGAWFLMATGYSVSGLIKLQSPSWVDGTAFHHLIDGPLARPGLIRDLFLASPPWVLAVMTWSTLAAEISFLPLCVFRLGRAIAWSVMLSMHLGIVLAVDFADLSFGMVMIHLFTFDPEWLPQPTDKRSPVLLFDGECGLCNWVARFIMREDASSRMRFATLQSPTAQEYLRQQGLPTDDFDSLVFVPNWNDPVRGGYKLRTAGLLATCAELGGVWRVMSWLRLVPAVVRDPAYRLVARSRYAIFGTYLPGPLRDPAWETRFLTR